MRFQETHEGDYWIYAGAVEAPRGDGYIAALVVNRVQGTGKATGGSHREAFRDDSLACGHRWTCPDEALRYAMNKARELIRSQSQMLVC
jgi:hypothetical protein